MTGLPRQSGHANPRISRQARGAIPAATLALSAAAACATVACSVLLDWSGYTGGLDAGAPPPVQDANAYRVTCGTNQYCAPEAPPGWEGPVVFAEVPSDAGALGCGAAYSQAFRGSADLDVPAAVCSCACDAPPTGTTCPMPSVTYFTDSNCSTPCGTPSMLSTSTCANPPSGCNALEVAAATPQGASCVPTDTETTLPPATWTRQSLECAPVDIPVRGSCSATEFCLPGPPPSLGYCVVQSGQAAACPVDSGYTQGPFVEYSGGTTEGRSCTTCRCDAENGSCIQPTGYISVMGNCNIPTVPFGGGSTGCLAAMGGSNGNGAKGVTESSLMKPGTCVASGALPVGTVAPADSPTSFCCVP